AVKALTKDDFRRHVLNGAEHRAALGQVGTHLCARFGDDSLDDAEIAEKSVAIPVKRNVSWLDVPVDKILRMEKVERLGDGLEPAGPRSRRQRLERAPCPGHGG